MEDIIVPTVLFGSIAAIIISLSYFKNRRIERTSLIASGKEASLFNEGEEKPKIFTALKFGVFFISIGIGLILGEIVYKAGLLSEPVAYTAMTILFGGIGLVVYYLLERRNNMTGKAKL